MEMSLDSLAALCLKQVAQSVAAGHIHASNLQDLPTHLLEDLAPVLSVYGLSRVHQVLQTKGIDVQQYWLKLYQKVFKGDILARRCSCHDSEFSNEDWRQRFLDKACQQRLQEFDHHNLCEADWHDIQSLRVLNILNNPTLNHGVVQKGIPLDDFCPSSLRLESRLLPYIQSDKTLALLQKNLRELVLSHYLPKYNHVLRNILECLIHNGVLRKFTLKHPKCLTPAELFSVLEVCAGRRAGIQGSGDEPERRKCHKRKGISGHLPESRHCDSVKSCSEKPTRPEEEECDALPHLQPAETQHDLYDFCFSEPIDSKSDVRNQDTGYPGLSEDCLGSPIPCTVCTVVTDGVVDVHSARSDLDSRDSEDTKTDSQQRHSFLTSPVDRSNTCICPPYRRPPNRCIQHLVICGFVLHQPDYSQVLQRVLSIWPGLKELEFIDNLMLKDSCHKILSAIIRSQSHSHSLRRLCMEDNSVQDSNLTLLKHLLLRTKLDTLELKTADLCFSDDTAFQDGSSDMQYPLCQLEDTFRQLSILNLSHNNLRSLACLERALLQPDCTIRHLDLESCQLSTQMLDRLFIAAKGSRFLRELNVGYNMYCPDGSQATRLSGLAELVHSSRLTKLNLTGCLFTLQGWVHATDFVKALRINNSLGQLRMGKSRLTNKCLHLLADAFICPSSDTDFQASRLCLDISYNIRVTYEGLRAFRQALEKASSTLGCKVTPPYHLTITMDEGKCSIEECEKMTKIMRVTVSHTDVNSDRHSCSGRNMNHADLMIEHLSQM